MGTLSRLGVALLLTACASPPAPDPLARANASLDDGAPKRALIDVGDAKTGPGLVARMQALIELDEWGTFERLLRDVPAGPERTALSCLQAAARRDVDGIKKCSAEVVVGPTLGDAMKRAHARVLETEHRRVESEAALRKLASEHPTPANHKALVAYLERQGFVREATVYVEGWLATAPGDTSLQTKLVSLLERKVRGDLLEKNAAEAEAAARRILVLDPKRAQVRYFLADALELKGDKTGASAERAIAKAAGATPPVAVDAMPGIAPEPGDDADEHRNGDGHRHP